MSSVAFISSKDTEEFVPKVNLAKWRFYQAWQFYKGSSYIFQLLTDEELQDIMKNYKKLESYYGKMPEDEIDMWKM